MGALGFTYRGLVAPTLTGTSITHVSAGVTYNFASPVTYGFYWNGDPFVVAGGTDVTITSITPEWSGSGAVIHGTMVQPTLAISNGFDSRVQPLNPPYNAGANRDPAANGGAALVISATTWPGGASVVKAVSASTINPQVHRGMIDKYSVLTVVPSVPPSNAFRPPVYGTDKVSHYRLSDLDFTKLKSVTPVSGQKPISDFAFLKEATYLSWYSGSEEARVFHPQSYRRDYNDYFLDDDIVPALMALHSDYTNDEKRDVYAGLVQQGLDYAAFNNAEGIWLSGTTHVELFPPVIATAAVALGEPQELLDALAVAYNDERFFLVPADLVGVELFSFTSSLIPGFTSYQDVHVGMPEWRVNAGEAQPALSAVYRDITADNIHITALLMDMLGNADGRTVLDRPEYFAYAERIRRIWAVGNFSNVHAPPAEWTAFMAAYATTYYGGGAVSLRPEAPQGITVANGAGGIDVAVTGFVYPGSSAVTRVDVRYKLGTGSWTVIENFGMSGTIPSGSLSTGLYFVQVRFVNSVGAGPWSDNTIKFINSTLLNAATPVGSPITGILATAGIVTQAEVNAAGGILPYRQTLTYKNHIRGVWDGAPGYQTVSAQVLNAVVVR